MATEPSQIVRFYRGFIIGALVVFVIVAISTCTKQLYDRDVAIEEVRAENGGVIPGKEAMDQYRNRYTVKTIQHNGNVYTCFSDDYRRMGCVKE